MYQTLTGKERDELLNAKDNRTYKFIGHQFVPLKGAGKQYCKSCGLVALRNKATQWCIDKGCNYDVHKDHDSTMKRLAKPDA